MREIKFRLRIGNKIVGYEKWDIGTGDNAGWFYCKNPNGKYPDNVWRRDYIYHTEKDQFTGLLDINNKEIYEGDILEQAVPLSDRYIGEGFVEFSKGCFIIKANSAEEHQIVSDWIRIIGNIYENPELLKGKSKKE